MFTDISNLSNSNIEDNKTLNEEQRKTIENGLFQLENILKQNLSQAYSENNYLSQCKILIELAQHHLNWKRYSAAAKLLNGALAISHEQTMKTNEFEVIKREILRQLTQIEVRFVEEQLKVRYSLPTQSESYGINPAHKKQLIELRNVVKKKLMEIEVLKSSERADVIQELCKWITKKINELLHGMVQECINLMPTQPPCDYALVGTGSLAREEMTPYSDLECFILIVEDKTEYKHYFTYLSQLLELKIINLGETDLVKGEKLLPRDMLSPTPKGFSLDVHKTPNNSKHNLIGTPLQMAQFQLPKNYINEPMNHLSDALLSVILITGTNRGKDLLGDYQKEVIKILSQTDANTQKTLSLIRFMSNLKDDIARFKPKLGPEDTGRLLLVKEDFYRLPQTIIDALALYQSLKNHSTLDRIDELCAKGLMLVEAGQRLKVVLSQANEWRLKTYCYYDEQKEIVDILARLNEVFTATSYIQQNHHGLTDDDIKILTEAYKTLIPLLVCIEHLCSTQGKENLFINDPLYDDSSIVAGMISIRLGQYAKARQLFEEEMKKDVNDTLQSEIDHKRNAILFNGLGFVCYILGDNETAKVYFEKNLANCILSYGSKHVEVAVIYNNLGLVWHKLGDFSKAIKCYEEALVLDTDIYDLNYPNTAATYSNLGLAWESLGNGKKAKQYHQKAMEILIKIYGDIHSKVATCHNNLGLALLELGDRKMAAESFEKALEIRVKIYGFKHPIIAGCYNNLGATWQKMGDSRKAREYFNNTLKILINIYGPDDPGVGMAYDNLGATYLTLRDAEKAIELHKKALVILTKCFHIDHPDIATVYNNLGLCSKALGINNKAREYIEKALAIRRKIYGEEHPGVAACYNFLAPMLDDNQKTKEYFEKALKIRRKIYGEEHPDVAVSYNNLGYIWMELGNSEKALYYTKIALAIRVKLFGPNHSEVVGTLHNLRAISLQNDIMSSDILQPLLFSQKSILKSEIKNNKEIEENEEKELAEAIQLSLEIAQNSEVTKSKGLTKK